MRLSCKGVCRKSTLLKIGTDYQKGVFNMWSRKNNAYCKVCCYALVTTELKCPCCNKVFTRTPRNTWARKKAVEFIIRY